MRRSPLRRTGGPKRKTWMRRRNPERLTKRRAEQFGPQAEACRQLPCLVCRPAWSLTTYREYARSIAAGTHAFTRVSDPSHIVSRGAGGTDRDCVPMCRRHHDEFHRIGREAFQAKHLVDLRAVADALAEAVKQ